MALDAQTLIPILGAELLRPAPNYIARTVFQPQQVWDASAQPGKSVRLDRYAFFGDDGSLTQDARRRDPNGLIGANNSRALKKTELYIDISEFTGPGGGDPNDPSKPGNIRLNFENIMLQQRNVYDISIFNDPVRRHQFHQSIGSATLMDDYQRTMDAFFINEALLCTRKYNPGDIADGGTYASGPPKFDALNDLETIVTELKIANVPVFEDGLYRALVHPNFMKHLRQDPSFNEIARYPGFAPIASMCDPNNAYAPMTMPHPNDVNWMQNPNMAQFYGSLIGQNSVGTMANAQMFPTGFVYKGVRFFESNNIPTELVPLNYTSSADVDRHPTGLANRKAFPGIFFGQQLIGEALASAEPVRCKLNSNDDFGRFAIIIWQAFGGWKLLNPDFGIVCRSYGN